MNGWFVFSLKMAKIELFLFPYYLYNIKNENIERKKSRSDHDRLPLII